MNEAMPFKHWTGKLPGLLRICTMNLQTKGNELVGTYKINDAIIDYMLQHFYSNHLF